VFGDWVMLSRWRGPGHVPLGPAWLQVGCLPESDDIVAAEVLEHSIKRRAEVGGSGVQP
jgi:hypothetical protein